MRIITVWPSSFAVRYYLIHSYFVSLFNQVLLLLSHFVGVICQNKTNVHPVVRNYLMINELLNLRRNNEAFIVYFSSSVSRHT